MNPQHADLRQQLHAPDPVGRDLALLRTRLFRFSNDLRWYVLAESLEESYIRGRRPEPATMTAIRAFLDKIRRDGRLAEFRHDLAAAEDINIGTALEERQPYIWHRAVDASPPANVVVIVGAPRSGTSHLFNLLAATGRSAYFTTASCWAWPVRNLHHPGRHLYTALADTALADTVLAVDNKRTRIIPGLVMPGEAEDIWNRAMQTYHHIRGHCYDLSPEPRRGDTRILHAAASAHLQPRRAARQVAIQLLSHSPDRTALGHRRKVCPYHPRPARDSQLHATQPLQFPHTRPAGRHRRRMVAIRRRRPRPRTRRPPSYCPS